MKTHSFKNILNGLFDHRLTAGGSTADEKFWKQLPLSAITRVNCEVWSGQSGCDQVHSQKRGLKKKKTRKPTTTVKETLRFVSLP